MISEKDGKFHFNIKNKSYGSFFSIRDESKKGIIKYSMISMQTIRMETKKRKKYFEVLSTSRSVAYSKT